MNNPTSLVVRTASFRQDDYTQLDTWFDRTHAALWYYMRGEPRPCFTPTLLAEIRSFQAWLAHRVDERLQPPVRYLVAASKVPGVFNLGGDLDLFRRLIVTRNREGLLEYARACIDTLYPNMIGLDRDLTTISLVQGDALGGGFEGALSSHVLVAERSARMGLPEVLFNLFPGMGAWSMLSRKLDGARAERLILSGKVYNAAELYDLGVVDVLAEDGEGERAVYAYIQREERSRNGYRALRAAKKLVNPITYGELMEVTRVWVDAALRLEARDLRMMERLVSRQAGKSASAA